MRLSTIPTAHLDLCLSFNLSRPTMSLHIGRHVYVRYLWRAMPRLYTG